VPDRASHPCSYLQRLFLERVSEWSIRDDRIDKPSAQRHSSLLKRFERNRAIGLSFLQLTDGLARHGHPVREVRLSHPQGAPQGNDPSTSGLVEQLTGLPDRVKASIQLPSRK